MVTHGDWWVYANDCWIPFWSYNTLETGNTSWCSWIFNAEINLAQIGDTTLNHNQQFIIFALRKQLISLDLLLQALLIVGLLQTLIILGLLQTLLIVTWFL